MESISRKEAWAFVGEPVNQDKERAAAREADGSDPAGLCAMVRRAGEQNVYADHRSLSLF